MRLAAPVVQACGMPRLARPVEDPQTVKALAAMGAPAPEGGGEAGAAVTERARRNGSEIGDGLRMLGMEVQSGANRGPSHPLRHYGYRASAFGHGSRPVSGPPGNTSARIEKPRREAAAVGACTGGIPARSPMRGGT